MNRMAWTFVAVAGLILAAVWFAEATQENERGGAGNVAGVGSDGTLHINGTEDIRLGPGWNASVRVGQPGCNGALYIGEVDVLATLHNLTAEVTELRAWRKGFTANDNETHCLGATTKTLNCSSPGSRQEIARLAVCEVAEVVDCCCEEFYALRRVSGNVHVDRNVTHLQFGNVKQIGGSVATETAFDDRGTLASIDFGMVERIGKFFWAAYNELTSVAFGRLTNIGGSLSLHYNDLTTISLGPLTKLSHDLRLFNNDLTSIDFGALTTVGSDVSVSNNDLTSIDFSGLQSVGGGLRVQRNNGLTSVDCLGLGTCVCTDPGVSVTNCSACCPGCGC